MNRQPWTRVRTFAMALERGARIALLSIAIVASAQYAGATGDPPAAVSWLEFAPPLRSDHAAAFDRRHDRLIVIGGDEPGMLLTPAWSVDVSAIPARWTRLAASGTAPPPLHGHTATYDPVRDRILVVGVDGCCLAVWSLDLSGSPVWSKLAATQLELNPRLEQSTIYDPVRDRLIVFGGTYRYQGFNSSVFMNDVWALSLSGVPNWTEITPAGTPPTPRYGQVAVYDPAFDRMLIYGGLPASPPATFAESMDEVWQLSLTSTPRWKFLPPTSQAPKVAHHVAAVDSLGARMLTFGGTSSTYGLSDSPTMVWALSLDDTSNARWTPLAAGGIALNPRVSAGAAFDPARRRLLIHGGIEESSQLRTVRNELSAFDVSGTPAWLDLSPVATPPSGRSLGAAILDPVRDRMVVVGGTVGGPSGPPSYLDVWVSPVSGDSATWTSLVVAPGPTARYAHTAIYDAPRDRVIVFGGFEYGPTLTSGLNDVWALTLSGPPHWTLLTPAGAPPHARYNHSAIFDPVGQRMIVFGGIFFDGTRYVHYDDTWWLSLDSSPTWTQLDPPATSGVRYGHVALYDVPAARMLVVGGADSLDQRNDVWALSLGSAPSWSLVATNGSPPPLAGRSAVIDLPRNRVVMFGGAAGSSTSTDANVWALSLGVIPTWTPLTPSGPSPGSRYAPHVAGDPARNRVLMFSGGLRNDLWALRLGDSQAMPSIMLVSASGDEGFARLQWREDPPIIIDVTVYRSVSDGPWLSLVTLITDGSGDIYVHDLSVTAGTTYKYRLGVQLGGSAEQFFGQVEVSVPGPGGSGVALAGARPNPAIRALQIQFTLASAAPARLELLDLRWLADRTGLR